MTSTSKKRSRKIPDAVSPILNIHRQGGENQSSHSTQSQGATLSSPILTPAPLATPQMGVQGEQTSKRPRFLFWLIGGVVAVQLLAPAVGIPELSPTRMIGSLMADFSRQITAVSVENQLLVARGQKLAESIAETEAEYANKRGACGLVGIFGQEFANPCNMLVDQFYIPKLRQARADLASIHRQLQGR